MNDTTKGYLLALAGVAIFGLTLPFTRMAVAELPPAFVGLGRSVVAALIAGFALALTRQRRPARADLMRLVLAGLGIIVGFPLLSAMAMRTAPASHGGVVLGVLPLATAAAAMIFAGERPSRAFWAWGVAGSAAVVAFAIVTGGGGGLHGADLLLAGAVVSAAMGYAISGDMARRLGGWQVISWCLLVMLPLIVIPVMFTLPEVNWAASPRAWASFAYVAVFSQFLGFFFWNNGLALAGVARAGQVQLLQIFVTLAGSWALLGEPLSALTFAFAGLVAACVWMGRKA